MKASKLIEELQDIINLWGDLEVTDSMDNIIESIEINEGPRGEYITFYDDGEDIQLGSDTEKYFYDY